jgi:hypothetical protein
LLKILPIRAPKPLAERHPNAVLSGMPADARSV